MSPIPALSSIEACKRLASVLPTCSDSEQTEIARHLCRTDLFWLLWFGLGRKDVAKPWLFDRCREVQADPNGRLDLWARDHYKSTIITFGATIQSILASHGDDPLTEREECIGIFSHTRPIAKGFLRQIKFEFERNALLKSLFPDILWEKPDKEAPKWSEDDGITVRRKGNPKEATLEAWGLVDGQPIGKHYTGMVYDDVVTRESVNTPEMIAKTTEAVELSFNLGSQGQEWRRMIGTRYHFSDTYKTMMERGTFSPRLYAATENGEPDGEPVFLSREIIQNKRRDMGPYTFSAQMLLNPVADKSQGFREEWLRYYEGTPADVAPGTNRYMLVDAANEKRKSSDYTAIWIIGLGKDGNRYVLDMVRDRLNLTERAREIMRLHRKWKPREVRYERYGLMGDVQHIKTVQASENYRFEIIEVGGSMPKSDRIKRLIPLFEQGEVWLPQTLYKTDQEGKTRDLVEDFREQEYKAFPVAAHDDMLDSLARMEEPDLPLVWPKIPPEQSDKDRYAKKARTNSSPWAN